MDKILVVGGKRLQGEIQIGGAKNAALPIIAASLLASEEVRLKNVPGLNDISTMRRLLERLGTKIVSDGGKLYIKNDGIISCEASYDVVKTMRASVLVLGPLVTRYGEARVSLPGGCAIGARPINLHLMGLEKMGAKIKIEHGYVIARAGRLKGARIYLDFPTVTGTENLMIAATMADGTTIIENAACEPEIVDLADFLVGMGARIRGSGSDLITIEGVDSLNGTEYKIMPDRIEAGTYMVAAAITGGDLFIRGCPSKYLDAVIIKLREAGVNIVEDGDGLRVSLPKSLRSIDIKTMPYPGFPTDMQAQMMALMSISSGTSIITETIFDNRFSHVAELKRLGADIKIEANSVMVRGVAGLSGANVMASDLRASASLILAGLAAEGETLVSRVYHLDRGYERIVEKLGEVGARIERITSC